MKSSFLPLNHVAFAYVCNLVDFPLQDYPRIVHVTPHFTFHSLWRNWSKRNWHGFSYESIGGHLFKVSNKPPSMFDPYSLLALWRRLLPVKSWQKVLVSIGWQGLAEQPCVTPSLSRVRLPVTPWTAALHTSLSFTISWSLLKSIWSVILSNHFILSCPPVFPGIGVFTSESALPIRWPQLWSYNPSIGCSVWLFGSVWPHRL